MYVDVLCDPGFHETHHRMGDAAGDHPSSIGVSACTQHQCPQALADQGKTRDLGTCAGCAIAIGAPRPDHQVCGHTIARSHVHALPLVWSRAPCVATLGGARKPADSGYRVPLVQTTRSVGAPWRTPQQASRWMRCRMQPVRLTRRRNRPTPSAR